MDEDAAMAEHIADAELTMACASAVRRAIHNSPHLSLSIAEERAVVARGARYLLDAGAYLRAGWLFLPTRSEVAH